MRAYVYSFGIFAVPNFILKFHFTPNHNYHINFVMHSCMQFSKAGVIPSGSVHPELKEKQDWSHPFKNRSHAICQCVVSV